MNDITGGGYLLSLKRLLLAPYYEAKWKYLRWKVVGRMLACLQSEQLEVKLQVFRQSMHDHEFAKRIDEYKAMKSFCEGIEYCLYGDWRTK